MTLAHVDAPTRFVEADGMRFAYRRFGATDGVPLVFLQHFTGTMDSWDPSVVDGFARERPVVLFDNAGVSRSGGITPDDVSSMADHAAAFIAALGLTRVDLLGFSLGGFIAQVVAVAAPRARETRHPRGYRARGRRRYRGFRLRSYGRGVQASPAQPRLFLFFDQTESSQGAGRAFIERQALRIGRPRPGQQRADHRRPADGDRRAGARRRRGWRGAAAPHHAARPRRERQGRT